MAGVLLAFAKGVHGMHGLSVSHSIMHSNIRLDGSTGGSEQQTQMNPRYAALPASKVDAH